MSMLFFIIVAAVAGALFDMLFFKRFTEGAAHNLKRENQMLRWRGLAKDARIADLERRVPDSLGPRRRDLRPREEWHVPTQLDWPPIEGTQEGL